jgi:hypothetical protein
VLQDGELHEYYTQLFGTLSPPHPFITPLLTLHVGPVQMHQVADVARLLVSYFSPAVVQEALVALRAWKQHPFAILHDALAWGNFWDAFELLRDETVDKALRVRPVSCFHIFLEDGGG